MEPTADVLWPWQADRVGRVALSRISVGTESGTESCKDTRLRQPQPSNILEWPSTTPAAIYLGRKCHDSGVAYAVRSASTSS